MKRTCPSCGREVNKLYNGLCYKCYKKTKSPIEEIKKVYICRYCSRIRYKNKWVDSVNGKYIAKYIICNNCKGYIKKYNLILQFRNIDITIKDLLSNLIKNNKDIVKKIDYKDDNNFDIYLYVKKGALNKYIRLLKAYGKIKITRKLYGYNKNNGRKVYITTILTYNL
ncbi:hypothetical protein MJ1_0024 [Nanobdella aerobiophila]|uniref:Nmd3 N-terminal domain-containing protein n=1 Tax=Nanobdella aerobiophila TaxID=2586965 RepID=A0A915WRG6_9ARCH|nr:60S ribosomal export protein NMD3 [Nanobdella aerobiophila]BBL45204.1 hypothetical protein MJ1_0024 [Nanobdella aerobiophila]